MNPLARNPPQPAADPLDAKRATLLALIRSFPSCAIAYSGGVDSAVVAQAAFLALGDQAVAVTGVSASLAEGELAAATELAQRIGIRHVVLTTREFERPGYVRNAGDRCYHCKTELFSLLRQIADTEGYAHIVDGTNADDLKDHRPGRKAAQEKAIESPLQDIGFTKEDIRAASRQLGLKTSDKPAFSCLASRFPYGDRITIAGLKAVEQAENALRELGFEHLRVRVHGDIARIEVPPSEIARLASHEIRETVVQRLRACGYRYIAVDLQGYRRGSLNEGLSTPAP